MNWYAKLLEQDTRSGVIKMMLFVAVVLGLFIAWLLPSEAKADERLSAFVEVQTVYPELEKNLVLDGGLRHWFNDQWSVKAFFMVKSAWAQAHVGPVWQPLPWLQVGASLGASQNSGKFRLRTAYCLIMAHKGFSFSGFVELDHVAYQGDHKAIWYDLNLMYKALPWLSVGVKDRRPVGLGPSFQFRYWKATLWVAWAPFGSERAEFVPERFVFGLKFGF
jgi:hypothetical protein